MIRRGPTLRDWWRAAARAYAEGTPEPWGELPLPGNCPRCRAALAEFWTWLDHYRADLRGPIADDWRPFAAV